MKLYSIHFNRPDFIKIQADLAISLGYDLIIVNNGSNKDISAACEELSLKFLETKNISNGSISHGSAINQILPKINYEEDYGIIDHDFFIFKRPDFGDCDIIGKPLVNGDFIPYLWPGLMLFKAGIDIRGIDFRPNPSIRGDTGCDTYNFIKSKKIKWCTCMYSGTQGEGPIQDNVIVEKYFINDAPFAIHYLNGSNWTGSSKTNEKNELLKDLLK